MQNKIYYIYSLLIIMFLSACSAFQHGWTTIDYQGQVLSAKSGPGAERLKIEMDFNPAVSNYVLDKGTPDYIFVASDTEVALVSIARDEVVRFIWPLFASYSDMFFYRPIPEAFVTLINPDDKERLVSSRIANKSKELDKSFSTSQETMADAVKRCYAISSIQGTTIECSVENVSELPTMVIQLNDEKISDQYWRSQVEETVRIFCTAANNSNRRAVVYQVVKEKKARQHECELGQWGDWYPLNKKEVGI